MNNQWLQYGPTSNKFRQSYIKGFLDVSGTTIIRNGSLHLLDGDISMNGNLLINGSNITNHITDTSNNLSSFQTRVDTSLNTVFNNLETTDTSLNTLTTSVSYKRDSSDLVFNGTTQLAGHLIPSTTGIYDIGTTSKRFRSIYVDEAHLSANTLYIGDTPILGTHSNTIQVKADENQSIDIITTGSGNSKIQSEHDVSILTSGSNADVKVQATGTNSKVRVSGTGGIELTSDVDAQADLLVGGNLTVTGNVISNGTQFTVNSTTVTTADNVIVLNKGEVGTGVTNNIAGLQIDRGSASDFQFVFDESIDKFKSGFVGGTFENIATETYVDASVNALATRVIATENSGSSLDTSMNAVENRLTTAETDINVLDTSMNAVESRLTTAETDIGSLDTSMNSVESRLTTTETDIGSFDTSMNSVETRLTSAETDIGTLDTSMNSVETRLTTVEADINVLDTSMNSVETRLTTTETNIGTLDTSMNSVETRLTTVEADIGTLDTSMNAVVTNITSAEADIGTLDTSMNSVESRVTTTEADINVLDTSMNSVESRVTTTETDINALDTSMNAVETRLTTTETDINALDTSMNSVESRLTTAETDINALDTSMNAVEDNLVLKANLASPTFTGTVSGITKTMVGLGNVDNTSDASKPVSTAQQTALDLKANLASPTFTGNVLAPTQTSSDNSAKVATTAYVKTVVNELVDGAPGTIDTLNELAAALGDDANFATTITNSIASKADLASPTFTGTLNVNGNLDVSGDAEINNAHVGKWGGSNLSYACFSHNTKNTETDYALMQFFNGATYLNSSGTNALRLRQNNDDRLVINSSGDVDISNNLIVGGDTTMTGNLTISKLTPSTENAEIIILCNGWNAGSPPNVYSQVYVGEDLNHGAYYRYAEDYNIITLGQNNGGSEIDMISWNRNGLDFTIHKDTEITGNLDVSGNLTISNSNEIYYKGQTLDARFNSLTTNYYTEAESDARFVKVAGDTMTGDLTINRTTAGANLTIAGNSNWEGAKITLNNLSTTSSKLPYVDFTNRGYRYAYLGYGNAVNGGTDNHIDLVLERGSYFKIVSGDLKVDNPNEITYKNQTLDDRFVPKLTDENRAVNWSEIPANNFEVNFGSWNNNNSSPWADCIHFNTFYNSTGGMSNLLCLKKTGGFGMRIFQPTDTTYQNSTNYTNYRDVVLADTTGNVDITGNLSVGGELTINDILTFDKAKCKTTGEIFEDNIINSTALATGTWHRIMTAGNNVGGTLVIALNQSGRHCYYEIKFSNCFWEESSLRVVNHHTFGVGGNAGVSAIRVQSDTTSNYSGTAFDIYTNNTINGNEITINLKNAYTQDDYSLVDFTPNPTDLNSGVDIKTLELDLINTAFGGVRADSDGTTISDFRFSRTGLLTASSANITGGLDVTGDATINSVHVGKWVNNSSYACFSHSSKNTASEDYALMQFFNGATYLNSSGTNPLRLRQNNDDRLVINSSGDVDITNDLIVGGDTTMTGKLTLGQTSVVNNPIQQTLLQLKYKMTNDSERSLLFKTPSGNTSIDDPFVISTGNALSFVVDNLDALKITASRNVEVLNNLDVGGDLDVDGQIRGNGIRCDNRINNSIASKDGGVLWIANGSTTASTTSGNWTAWNDTSAGLRFEWKSNIAVSPWYNKGYISKGSYTGIFNNFTGQHHNYGVSELIDETGFIVSSTGKYRNQMSNCDECNKYKININESLPIVEYSQQINDTKVWGVISDKDDTNTVREKPFGNFVTEYEQAEEDRPLTINSLGEGAVWVSNINGPITNGDYITTCVLPGLGMKQYDDVLHSYTVAKITTDCSFDEMDMVPRKSIKYETVSKTREISKEVEKDVFERWEDDYDEETYTEEVEQQIIDKILKTIQEEIITYDASGIPNVQIIEKTIEEEIPRVKQIESTDASGNDIINTVPEMETVSVNKIRKIPKMINVTLKDASNNDLLDEQGYPITKQYQAKKAVYKKHISQETVTEVYDVSRAVINPDTQQYVYDIKTDGSGNTLYVEKYEMKYIIVSTDKYSVYNDKEHTELYKEFDGDFSNIQVNGESIIGKAYKMAFLGCTYHCG